MYLTEQALFHTFMVMDECLFCFEPRQRLNKDKTGLQSYLYDAAILTDRSGQAAGAWQQAGQAARALGQSGQCIKEPGI